MTLILSILLLGCSSEEKPEPSSQGDTAGTQLADDTEASAPCGSQSLPNIDLEAASGVRHMTSSYTVPWDNSQREIDLHLWYPTVDSEGEAAFYLDAFFDENSWVDAAYTPVDSGCKRPLVVYSHGSRAWAGNASPILRQFVQAGWVAIGPDHTGNTIIDNWDPRPEMFDLMRRQDIWHAIDYLEQLPASDPLYQQVDTQRVLVIGHSYGAEITWLLAGAALNGEAQVENCSDCSEAENQAFLQYQFDDRIAAAIPMAGKFGEKFIADDGFASIQVPVLMMTGSEDFEGQPHFERAAQTPDLRWLDLEGGCHESFTSLVVTCPDMEKNDSLTIVSTYALAFGLHYIEQLSTPSIEEILGDANAVSAAATLTLND